jgi:tetratricopeptide (TPR) repeat protein
MELTIEQALQQGVAAHKAGKLEEAERLYRAILQSQPLHSDANHNLGVLAVSVNKADAALPLFKTALEANPKMEQFWLSYIDALIKEKQFDNAKQVLEQAKKQGVAEGKLNILETQLTRTAQVNEPKLVVQNKSLSLSEKRKKLAEQKKQKKAKKHNLKAISPSDTEINILIHQYQAGQYGDAEKLALSITERFPEHEFGWKVLGAVLKQTGRVIDSLTAMQKSVKLAPQDAEAHSNLGNTLKELGRLDEALASYTQAIALKPDYAEAHYNLGITLQELGRLDEAEASYTQAIALKPDYAEAHYNLGITLQELGRLDEAEASYTQAIALKPDYAEAHYNLGITLKELGRLDEAAASYMQAIALKPDYALAHTNLGNTLKELGRLDESEASFRQAIALKPDYALAHSNLGGTLQELGRLDEALASLNQAIAFKPDFAEAHSNLGNSLQELGRLDEALASCRQAIALKPDFAEAHSNLGITLKELGRLDEALASCRQAIALKPDFAEAHSNLGITLKELGRLDEALASYTQAIALKPDYALAHSNIGNSLQELGRLDEALASYKQAIGLKPDFAEAHRALTSMKKFESKDEQYSKMLELYLDKNISEEQRCHINFGLAKASEDLGDYEQAYTYYGEGNALRKRLLTYDINQDVELFKQLKSSYPKIEKNSLEPDKLTKNLMPVFIVGMPRSGTTLVEQIVSSHSQVTGAGELNFARQFGAAIAAGITEVNNDALLDFRQNYLNKLQNVSNGNLIVTDKMPQNFRYIGLLAAAFPEAKIIYVKRNPAAVCWANYKQYFVSKSLGYCYGLDDVISYHKLYENLMEFWTNMLSNRIYKLDYELLTVNQESETRQLIEYLGLDWDENCLSPQNNTRSVATASNLQVRQKVYQGSSEQWKKYEPFLHGAFDGLLLS